MSRLLERTYPVLLCHQTDPSLSPAQCQMVMRRQALPRMTLLCLPQRQSFVGLSQLLRPQCRSQYWCPHLQYPPGECHPCLSSARWFPFLQTTLLSPQLSPALLPASHQLSAHLCCSWALRCPRAPSCLWYPSPLCRAQSLQW